MFSVSVSACMLGWVQIVNYCNVISQFIYCILCALNESGIFFPLSNIRFVELGIEIGDSIWPNDNSF